MISQALIRSTEHHRTTLNSFFNVSFIIKLLLFSQDEVCTNKFPAVRFTDDLASAAHGFRYQSEDRNSWTAASLMV